MAGYHLSLHIISFRYLGTALRRIRSHIFWARRGWTTSPSAWKRSKASDCPTSWPMWVAFWLTSAPFTASRRICLLGRRSCFWALEVLAHANWRRSSMARKAMEFSQLFANTPHKHYALSPSTSTWVESAITLETNGRNWSREQRWHIRHSPSTGSSCSTIARFPLQSASSSLRCLSCPDFCMELTLGWLWTMRRSRPSTWRSWSCTNDLHKSRRMTISRTPRSCPKCTSRARLSSETSQVEVLCHTGQSRARGHLDAPGSWQCMAPTPWRWHDLDVASASPYIRLVRPEGALPAVAPDRPDQSKVLEKPGEESMRTQHTTTSAGFARSRSSSSCSTSPLEFSAWASSTRFGAAADPWGIWLYAVQVEMQEQSWGGCASFQKTWTSIQTTHAMRSPHMPLLFETFSHDAEAQGTSTSFGQMQRNLGWSQHELSAGSWMRIDWWCRKRTFAWPPTTSHSVRRPDASCNQKKAKTRHWWWAVWQFDRHDHRRKRSPGPVRLRCWFDLWSGYFMDTIAKHFALPRGHADPGGQRDPAHWRGDDQKDLAQSDWAWELALSAAGYGGMLQWCWSHHTGRSLRSSATIFGAWSPCSSPATVGTTQGYLAPLLWKTQTRRCTILFGPASEQSGPFHVAHRITWYRDRPRLRRCHACWYLRFLVDLHPERLHHCNARRAPVRILVSSQGGLFTWQACASWTGAEMWTTHHSWHPASLGAGERHHPWAWATSSWECAAWLHAFGAPGNGTGRRSWHGWTPCRAWRSPSCGFDLAAPARQGHHAAPEHWIA